MTEAGEDDPALERDVATSVISLLMTMIMTIMNRDWRNYHLKKSINKLTVVLLLLRVMMIATVDCDDHNFDDNAADAER